MSRYLGPEYRPRLAGYRPGTSGILACHHKCRSLTGPLQTGVAMEVPGSQQLQPRRRCLLRLAPEHLEDSQAIKAAAAAFSAARG